MRLGLDAVLIIITAVVWLTVAAIYRLVDMIDMPDAERVWTASAGLFLLLVLWVRTSETRGQKKNEEGA